ncbi:MAG: AMP-binding protein, partial [Oscillospiraceae bacterium]|nr:AMP-binding protein [Oscillospiraceae bacterium]
MKQQAAAGLDLKLQEMAQRIRDLREIVGLTPEDMARLTDVSLEEYLRCEAGESDLNFAFIYRCAQACGVDVTDIIEGASPRLSNYTLTRAGEGQHIEHAHGMTYYNMAARFKKRVAEPLYVVAEYSEEAQLRPIECTTHEGQECDIVLSGQLKVQVGEHIEILNPGDIIYYNSTASHGMIATGGRECVFYAIVLEGPEDAVPAPVREKKLERRPEPAKPDQEPRIWEKFITVQEGGDGSLEKIEFKDPDRFNFAFDVVDGLARRKPDKLAMLHVDRHKVERYFTFQDMARYSSRAANYFLSLGIKRGDRVLLILKRHYQFWFAILGLHKIGAVALLASNQMMEHDLAYRYQAAGISAVVCTSNGQVSYEAERAAEQFPGMVKIMVDGRREGWHDFDGEFRLFSDEFVREKDAPCGEDLMLMFFTSGTTGFPKAAAQCYKYPLGHFVTAKYWHCVDPEGLHLTISDTGWAKAMWGKLYG